MKQFLRAAALLCAASLLLSGCGRSVFDPTTVPETEAVSTAEAGSETTAPDDAPVLPETATDAQTDGTFTAEELQKANSLTALVKKYRRVRRISYRQDTEQSRTVYFLHDGQIVSAQKMTSEGEAYYSGTIGNRYYEKTGDHLQMHYYFGDDAADDEAYVFDEDISSTIVTGTITDLQDGGDVWTFGIEPKLPAGESTVTCRYTADKKTLSLREATLVYEGGETYRHVFTYGDAVPQDTFGLLDGLGKPYRTVTVCTQLHDANGGEHYASKEIRVPYNVEIVPTADSPLSLYANESFTKEYAYPGNGASYAVWATDAMG